MSKKLLLAIGIILLLVVGAIGVRTFIIRHDKKELIPTTTNQPPAANTQTPVPSTVPAFDKKQYSIDDPASSWVIVNKSRALKPVNYAPADLVSVGNGQQMRSAAAAALARLIGAAKTAGLAISPLSGYRSYATQQSVYNKEVATYGQAVADSESARPGHSEHQTGWAVDVGGGGCGIEDCFGNTAEGKWLAAHAYEYGFIIRYTAAKQSITGYRAEPWHIRYIGSALSNEMQKENVTTLEEFFGL